MDTYKETVLDAVEAYLDQALELVEEDLPKSQEADIVRSRIREAKLWLWEIDLEDQDGDEFPRYWMTHSHADIPQETA